MPSPMSIGDGSGPTILWRGSCGRSGGETASSGPLPRRPIGPQPGRGQVETHRWHQMVQQALHEHGPAQSAGQGCLMEQPAKPNVPKILDTTPVESGVRLGDQVGQPIDPAWSASGPSRHEGPVAVLAYQHLPHPIKRARAFPSPEKAASLMSVKTPTSKPVAMISRSTPLPPLSSVSLERTCRP